MVRVNIEGVDPSFHIIKDPTQISRIGPAIRGSKGSVVRVITVDFRTKEGGLLQRIAFPLRISVAGLTEVAVQRLPTPSMMPSNRPTSFKELESQLREDVG